MAYATARKHDVNFGDKLVFRGAERRSFAEISLGDGGPCTVYAAARVEPAAARVFPLARIEWGHGGASLEARELRIYRRLRFPVVGSTVRVSGRMVDESGNPPPKTVLCRMTAFIALGSDGETQRSTTWISQHGAEGLVSGGPELVLTVEGYPAVVGPRWLMFFDATARPPNGTFPVLATPARRAYRRDRFDGQGFRFGVYWAASSTPIGLTFDPTADLRVDTEVLT
jgi:hypothetical protein